MKFLKLMIIRREIMKRGWKYLLNVLLLVVLLTACGQEVTPGTSQPTDTSVSTTEPAPKPTEAIPPADWLWERLPGSAPTAWSGMATVFDENRGMIILFGGRTFENVPLSETWEFNGITWNQVKTSHAPPARLWHGMAYDSTRKVVILFGGNASTSTSSYLNDTWEYNGRDWTQVETPATPAPRSNGALVYDSCRQVTVLFGGENADGNDPSSWEYDGHTWTKKPAEGSPPGRGLAAMVFDPVRCRTILFGGGSGGNGLNDTWEYDGAAWLQVQTAHTPEGRWAHAMAYYPAAEGVVLFGGYLPGSSTTANDTWLYDGADWLQLHPDDAPVAQEQHILIDGFRGRNLLLLGNGEMWIFLHRDAVAALTLTPETPFTSQVTPSPAQLVNLDSLAAYYPFNGNANDASGNENNGIVHGATLATDRFGNANNAYYFDGSSTIEIPNNDMLTLDGDFSIGLWVNIPNSNQNSAMLIINKHKASLNDDGSWGFFVQPPGNQLVFSATQSVDWRSVYALDSFSFNSWHCVFFTYQDGKDNWNFYLDGSPAGSGEYDFNIQNTDMSIYLGAEQTDYGFQNYFTGQMDEMYFFQRALSTEEVNAVCATNPGTTAFQKTPVNIPATVTPYTDCTAGWSRLSWGGDAIVTPGELPNRVRSAPNTNPDNIIATIYPGAIVHLIEGPWCNDGLVFWKVENESIPGGSGWTAEGNGQEYWLEPYKP
jgi:hypothetical protein